MIYFTIVMKMPERFTRGDLTGWLAWRTLAFETMIAQAEILATGIFHGTLHRRYSIWLGDDLSRLQEESPTYFCGEFGVELWLTWPGTETVNHPSPGFMSRELSPFLIEGPEDVWASRATAPA